MRKKVSFLCSTFSTHIYTIILFKLSVLYHLHRNSETCYWKLKFPSLLSILNFPEQNADFLQSLSLNFTDDGTSYSKNVYIKYNFKNICNHLEKISISWCIWSFLLFHAHRRPTSNIFENIWLVLLLPKYFHLPKPLYAWWYDWPVIYCFKRQF